MKNLRCTILFSLSVIFAVATQAQTRAVGDFNSVSVGGSIELKLVKSESPSLKYQMLKGDEDNLITKVKDGQLKIKIKNNWGFGDKSARAKVIVYYTDLSAISASAGSRVVAEEIIVANKLEVSCSSGSSLELEVDTKKLRLHASSGGSANVQGTTGTLSIGASSGGSVSAGNLIAEKVEAEASSGGSVSCHATEEITASSSSGGSIDYSGNPSNTDISKNVSGSVSRSN